VINGKESHKMQIFKKVIEINLYGTFNVCRLAALQMSKQEPINEDGERGVLVRKNTIKIRSTWHQ
jgi:3-hydroxyacyl-CoA dehydrogenase / 3-hydroxy-2-methylbutyryl-CoA dehydrogenase